MYVYCEINLRNKFLFLYISQKFRMPNANFYLHKYKIIVVRKLLYINNKQFLFEISR